MPSMKSPLRWRSHVSHEEQNDFTVGLEELVQVEGQGSINVVLIHDITDGRNTIWPGQISGEDGWYTLLTKAIPHARVFTFGYDTGTMTELSDMVDPTTLDGHAKAFLGSLRVRLGDQNSPSKESITDGNDAETTSEESLLPLIIVAHGYGGLIYERALVLERLSKGNFLANHFQLVFLLGTPHYDAGLGEWTIMCAKRRNIRCANNAQSQKWTRNLRDSIASIRETQEEVREILAKQDEVRPKISITGCFASLPVPGSKLMMSPDWAVMPEFTPVSLSVDHFELPHLCRVDHGSKEIASDGSEAIAAILRSWKENIERPNIIEHPRIGDQHEPAIRLSKLPMPDMQNMIEGKFEQAEELDRRIVKLKKQAAEIRQEAEQLYQKQHGIEEGPGQHPSNLEISKDFQPKRVESGQMTLEKRDFVGNQLARTYPRQERRYKKVSSLIINWGSYNGLRRERLNFVLERCLGSATPVYEEVSNDALEKLLSNLRELIETHGQDKGNLLVLYLLGGSERSSTYDWPLIENQILRAKCDIVIFHDRKEGTSITASEDFRSPRIEYLSAVSKDDFPNFTRALTQAIEGKIRFQQKDITISALHEHLSRNDQEGFSELSYAVLSEGSVGRPPIHLDGSLAPEPKSEEERRNELRMSVRPRPWFRPAQRRVSESKAQGKRVDNPPRTTRHEVYVKLTLFDALDKGSMDSLTHWLTRDSPGLLSGIELVEQASEA